MASDREALAKAIEDWLIDNRFPHAYDIAHGHGGLAEWLLASDWLAAYTRKAREEALAPAAAEDLRGREWDAFCRESDVRCDDCGLRYGERKDYSCGGGRGPHCYDEAELAEARELEPSELDKEYADALDEVRREVREETKAGIAGAIEAKYLGADFGRAFDGRESPDARLHLAHDEALEHAAHTAREWEPEVGTDG